MDSFPIQPVEFFLTSGSSSDIRALKMYHLNVPDGSLLAGDKTYNDYAFEDLLQEAHNLSAWTVQSV